MQIDVARFSEPTRRGFGRVVIAIVFATGALRPASWSRAEAPTFAADPATRRAVHARELPSTSVDDQTSWIIEPDVPRIPKIAGLDTQLPPQIERQLGYAFDLAQRGAVYSANAEFRAVIGLCALELDSRTGGASHREAFRQGLVALEEADDFGGDQIDWRESSDVRRVAADHTTTVLKDSFKPIDSVEAVQRYYAFAEERFTTAGKEMPGASLAFYGLARTFVEPGMHTTHAAAKAVLLQRVALSVAPQNVLARNELGVLLAQHGQLAESADLFRQCIAASPRPEAWRNLSVVYARQGDLVNSKAALVASETLAARDSNVPTSGPAATVAVDEAAKNGSNSADGQRKPSFMARLSTLSGPFRR